MFFAKKPKPRERFYLFPGQGGSNYYRKQKVIMRWTLVVAVFFGLALAAAMWWAARLHY